MADHIIQAKCVDKSFDSRNALNYIPGDVCEFNVTTGKVSLNGLIFPFDRQLFWGKTLGGRWSFEFDRANSSSTALRMFFCKECGQPFDRLNDLGNHTNSQHNKNKAIIGKVHDANADEEEDKLLAERLAVETKQNALLENAIAGQQDVR